jgi:hypothetical protein
MDLKMDKYQKLLKSIAFEAEYNRFKKLSSSERQLKFKRMKNAFIVGCGFAQLILFSMFVLFGWGSFIVANELIKFIYFLCMGYFGFAWFKIGLEIVPMIKMFYHAGSYLQLNPQFFDQVITKEFFRTAPYYKVIAAHTLVEYDEFLETVQPKFTTNYQVVEFGPEIGKIQGQKILDFIKMQNSETGQYKLLRYVGFHATDPRAEFGRIAPPNAVGYILDGVIYVEE